MRQQPRIPHLSYIVDHCLVFSSLCRAPKPAPGPHKQRECLPLSIILRNRLKYALTRKESLMIVMQKLVKVDGKVRTELNFPAGFMGACRRQRDEERFLDDDWAKANEDMRYRTQLLQR